MLSFHKTKSYSPEGTTQPAKNRNRSNPTTKLTNRSTQQIKFLSAETSSPSACSSHLQAMPRGCVAQYYTCRARHVHTFFMAGKAISKRERKVRTVSHTTAYRCAIFRQFNAFNRQKIDPATPNATRQF